MKIIVSSHVEPDRKGGLAYLINYASSTADLPIIHHLMFGEKATNKLLRFFKKRSLLNNNAIGLHVHGHQTSEAIDEFKKTFGMIPESISFGHWQAFPDDLKKVTKNGVKYNLSHAGYRNNEKYFIKAAFKSGLLRNIPVSCDPKHPINPLTTHMHFLFFLVLVFLFSPTQKTLHFSFHSYDLNNSIMSRIRFSVFSRVIKLFGTTNLNEAN